MPTTSHVAFSMTHDVKNTIMQNAKIHLSKHGIQFLSNLMNGNGVDDYINTNDGIAVNIKSIEWDTEMNQGMRLIYDAISNNTKHGSFAREAESGLIRELFGEYQKVSAIDVKWGFARNGTDG